MYRVFAVGVLFCLKLMPVYLLSLGDGYLFNNVMGDFADELTVSGTGITSTFTVGKGANDVTVSCDPDAAQPFKDYEAGSVTTVRCSLSCCLSFERL